MSQLIFGDSKCILRILGMSYGRLTESNDGVVGNGAMQLIERIDFWLQIERHVERYSEFRKTGFGGCRFDLCRRWLTE